MQQQILQPHSATFHFSIRRMLFFRMEVRTLRRLLEPAVVCLHLERLTGEFVLSFPPQHFPPTKKIKTLAHSYPPFELQVDYQVFNLSFE